MNLIEQTIAANPAATDAEIVAILAADKRTVRPIKLADLNPLAGDIGLYVRLELAAESMELAAAVAVRSFVHYCNSPHNQVFDTTDATRAARTAALLSQLVAGGVLAQAEADAIISLGGGYATAGIDEASVAAARAEAAKRAIIDESTANLEAAKEALFLSWREHVTQVINPWDGTGEQPAAWSAH